MFNRGVSFLTFLEFVCPYLILLLGNRCSSSQVKEEKAEVPDASALTQSSKQGQPFFN